MISIFLYYPSATVLIPTHVKTVLGLYMERGSVEAIEIKDTEGILGALREAWDRGISIVPHPKAFPTAADSPTIKAVRAKSWADFVRNSRFWTIEERNENVVIQGWFSPSRKSHFEPNSDDVSEFSNEIEIQVVFDHLISAIQNAAIETC